MDPVSHVIMGAVAVTAMRSSRSSQFGRAATVAGMIGAVAPDVDAVLMPRWDVYLRWHEVGTHSLLGAGLTGAAAAASFALLTGYRRPEAARGPVGRLAVAGIVGALTHLALDAGSGARLGLLWPLTDIRSPLPLFAMADLWLAGALTIGVVFLWLTPRDRPRTARLVLAGILILAAAKAVAYVDARRVVATAGHVPLSDRMFEARWGAWNEWFVHEGDRLTVRTWRVDRRLGSMELMVEQPRQLEEGQASRSLATVQNLLRVHSFAFATHSRAADGTESERWSDIRFCWQPPGEDDAVMCGLWFGGDFDVDGRAIRQVMQVGSWVQTRPPFE